MKLAVQGKNCEVKTNGMKDGTENEGVPEWAELAAYSVDRMGSLKSEGKAEMGEHHWWEHLVVVAAYFALLGAVASGSSDSERQTLEEASYPTGKKLSCKHQVINPSILAST